jgi:hypothetical protein
MRSGMMGFAFVTTISAPITGVPAASFTFPDIVARVPDALPLIGDSNAAATASATIDEKPHRFGCMAGLLRLQAIIGP